MYKNMPPEMKNAVRQRLPAIATPMDELSKSMRGVSISHTPEPAAAEAVPASSQGEQTKGKRKAPTKRGVAGDTSDTTTPGRGRKKKESKEHPDGIRCRACMEDGASCEWRQLRTTDNLPPCIRCQSKHQKCELLYYLADTFEPLIERTEMNNIRSVFAEGWGNIRSSIDAISERAGEMADAERKLEDSLRAFMKVYEHWRPLYDKYRANRKPLAEYSAGEYVIGGIRVIFEEPQGGEISGSPTLPDSKVDEENDEMEIAD